MKQRDLTSAQLQTDVTLMSFLSVLSIFFLGALLPEFDSFSYTVRIPISFLILSTLSFIFSALILANAFTPLVENDEEKLKKHIDYGYAVSEYLGFVLLIVSIPLAMSIITEDLYIRTVSFLFSIGGLIFYQFSGLSILDRHYSSKSKILSLFIIIFSVILFVSQIFSIFFTLTSILFLIFLFILTYCAPGETI